MPVLGDPSRTPPRRILPGVVRKPFSAESELYIGPIGLLIDLAGYATSLAVAAGREQPLGRPKPTGVLVWIIFGVNTLFGDSAGELKAATPICI